MTTTSDPAPQASPDDRRLHPWSWLFVLLGSLRQFLLPLVVLVELGVAVAIGVLIDTIVVRSLLVPALAYDIGPKVWWPSALSRQRAVVHYRPRHSR